MRARAGFQPWLGSQPQRQPKEPKAPKSPKKPKEQNKSRVIAVSVSLTEYCDGPAPPTPPAPESIPNTLDVVEQPLVVEAEHTSKSRGNATRILQQSQWQNP